MTRPDDIPADVWEATAAHAKDRADWLVDAVATSTQNPAFLRGEEEEDTWATEAILLNGEKAIRIAAARAILAERERCANVCDDFASQFPAYPEFDEQHNCARSLAASIRAGTPCP